MRKSLASVVSIAALVAACSGFGSEDEENQQPPPSSPEDNAKPPPDVPGKPIEGIYVSARLGKPGATGFPGSPFNTIAEGMKKAKETKLRLIVCAEEYAENFDVINGVSAYGYYDCSASLWKRTNEHAKVRAPRSPAMVALDITAPTRIEGFDVFAPDLDGTTAKDREGSSIGLSARTVAPNTLVIGEALVHGGKGAAGEDGTPAILPKTVGGATSRGTDGEAQSSSSCQPTMIQCATMKVPGVTGPAPQCEGGEPAPGPGGNGGDGVWFIDFQLQEPQTNDVRGRPFVATTATAAGAPKCEPNAIGCKGSNGAEAPAGSNGPNGVWGFDADGFILGNGTRGGSGKPGQGGGGGGSAPGWNLGNGGYGSPNRLLGGTGYFRSARAGSGGAGGCGGLAGTPGGGGGASIAAMAIGADVRFERVILEPSVGGRAGLGVLGSLGGSGGAGGTAGPGAGDGGDGGRGGPGGSSGHGAAGPSIALVWSGVRPARDGSTELRQGVGGEGRGAISQVVAPLQTIPAMPIGEAIAEYEIKR